MSENTWPDPARPGVPLNPERPGKHWLRSPGGEIYLSVWYVTPNPNHSFWEKGPGWSSPEANARSGWTYLGPVTLPDEAAALQARVAELEDLIRAVHRNAKNLTGDRTFDQCITALMWIDDLCRAAAEEGKKDE